MNLEKFLSEMNLDQEQRSYALAQGGVQTRPAVSLDQVQFDLIKNVLGHAYKPNEYSIGANGQSFDVAVGDQSFSGPFDKVLKDCVTFVTKPKMKK